MQHLSSSRPSRQRPFRDGRCRGKVFGRRALQAKRTGGPASPCRGCRRALQPGEDETELPRAHAATRCQGTPVRSLQPASPHVPIARAASACSLSSDSRSRSSAAATRGPQAATHASASSRFRSQVRTSCRPAGSRGRRSKDRCDRTQACCRDVMPPRTRETARSRRRHTSATFAVASSCSRLAAHHSASSSRSSSCAASSFPVASPTPANDTPAPYPSPIAAPRNAPPPHLQSQGEPSTHTSGTRGPRAAETGEDFASPRDRERKPPSGGLGRTACSQSAGCPSGVDTST